MPLIRDASGCWRWVAQAVAERWRAWRVAHPAWVAPVRAAIIATAACGAPVAVAGALALAPLVQEFASGGTLARFTSSPPGGSLAVGGAMPGVSKANPTDTSGGAALVPVQVVGDPGENAERFAPLRPVAVPEPSSVALLGVGVVLVVVARRRA